MTKVLSVEEFISELLSEGVVLRAWEILERKSAMKCDRQLSNTNSNRSKVKAEILRAIKTKATG